jgi:hypothetical protein
VCNTIPGDKSACGNFFFYGAPCLYVEVLAVFTIYTEQDSNIGYILLIFSLNMESKTVGNLVLFVFSYLIS